MVMVSVDVEVDLSDFETDDLIDELESRQKEASSVEEVDWQQLYTLLVSRRDGEVLSLLRSIVQEKTGRIIP